MEAVISSRGEVRQKIWTMTPENTEEFMQKSFVVRVGTVDQEGYPYVVLRSGGNGFVGGPGTYGRPFHAAAQEAESQNSHSQEN